MTCAGGNGNRLKHTTNLVHSRVVFYIEWSNSSYSGVIQYVFILAPINIAVEAIRPFILLVNWDVTGEQGAMDEFIAYVVGMGKKKRCFSKELPQCQIFNVEPLVPYEVCVRNCRQEDATGKAASSSIEGAQLVSGDDIDVAIMVDVYNYTCSDATCGNITIPIGGEKYWLVVLLSKHICD